jgi:hypothetical protein
MIFYDFFKVNCIKIPRKIRIKSAKIGKIAEKILKFFRSGSNNLNIFSRFFKHFLKNLLEIGGINPGGVAGADY